MKNLKTIKVLTLAAIGCSFIQGLHAQGYTDVLRYSQQFYSGSARSAGAGSAFGAVGADPISMTINPAGIGLYRKSEFAGTLSLARPRSEALYQGYPSTDDKFNLNIGNMDIIFSGLKYNLGKPVKEGWVAVNFGMGFTRVNSFQSNVTLEANHNYSILNSFAQEANGRDRNSLSLAEDGYSNASLAYNALLIDSVGAGLYSGIDRFEKPGKLSVLQRDEISTRGSVNDINFSLGGNYSNKLYLGASIIIPNVNYRYTRIFTEMNNNTPDSFYKGMQLTENVNTSGIGFSANFGVIYRPLDILRLGASVRIPTFYNLSDLYDKTLASDILKTPGKTVQSPEGQIDYTVTTPFRYTLSGALLLEKHGFLSADYEIVNYNDARLSYKGDAGVAASSRIENKNIQYFLQSGSNLRLGAELRQEAFAIRAGYSIYGSPYKSAFVLGDNNSSASSYSFGAGYRSGDFFADVAYQVYQTKYTYVPYKLTSVPDNYNPNAMVSEKRTSVMLTVGTRF